MGIEDAKDSLKNTIFVKLSPRTRGRKTKNFQTPSSTILLTKTSETFFHVTFFFQYPLENVVDKVCRRYKKINLASVAYL